MFQGAHFCTEVGDELREIAKVARKVAGSHAEMIPPNLQTILTLANIFPFRTQASLSKPSKVTFDFMVF